jgi:hypothetical protein
MSSERLFCFARKKGGSRHNFSNLSEIFIVVPWLFWHKLCFFLKKFINGNFQFFIFFREFFCVKENE